MTDVQKTEVERNRTKIFPNFQPQLRKPILLYDYTLK